MNGVKVNWIANFPLKIESSELKIVTKFESHDAYSCARCYRVSRIGGGGAVCVWNRQQKGPLLQFCLCHIQTFPGGEGISCDVRRCRRCCILVSICSLRQVQIRYRTGSAWRCACSGCKVRDRLGKPHPPNWNLRMDLLYSAKWDRFLLVVFFIRHQPSAAPPIVHSMAEAALTLDATCDTISIGWQFDAETCDSLRASHTGGDPLRWHALLQHEYVINAIRNICVSMTVSLHWVFKSVAIYRAIIILPDSP